MGEWRWTSKIYSLLIGLLLLAVGFLLSSRGGRFTLLGVLLMAAGMWALIYSSTVHGWCAPVSAKFDKMAWGQGFWHEPSAYDCWYLVRGRQ